MEPPSVGLPRTCGALTRLYTSRVLVGALYCMGMKDIMRALLAVTPLVVVAVIAAYIIEELLEDFVSETVSDFVYPIAALVVFGLVWYRVVPAIKQHYLSDTHPTNPTTPVQQSDSTNASQ